MHFRVNRNTMYIYGVSSSCVTNLVTCNVLLGHFKFVIKVTFGKISGSSYSSGICQQLNKYHLCRGVLR